VAIRRADLHIHATYSDGLLEPEDAVNQFLVPATFGDVRTIDTTIVDLLTRANADEFTIYNVQLAAHEVCTNIVEHAYAGRDDGTIAVTLRLARAPHRAIQIELRDRGRAFDPDAIPAPDLDKPQEGGYGLFLAKALLDELIYLQDADENVWRLNKLL
jgi:serine/threonine-protein kinase RsbW